MGSFDYTCAVSHLPIQTGDDVRFCLLQSSPYDYGKHAINPVDWYNLHVEFVKIFIGLPGASTKSETEVCFMNPFEMSMSSVCIT